MRDVGTNRKGAFALFAWLKNNKYRTVALYAIGVILISLSFFLVITNFTRIMGFISGVLDVFAPFIYGLIIAYLANPLLKLVERRVFRFKTGSKLMKFRRAFSLILTYLILFAIVTVFVWLIVPQVAKSFMDLETQIGGYITTAQNFVNSLVADISAFIGRYEFLSSFFNANELKTDLNGLITELYGYFESAANYVLKYGGRFVIELKNLLIGIIASVYLLLAKERLIAKLKRFLAAVMKRRHYLNLIYLMRYTDKTVGGFLIGKVIDSVIIGFLTLFVMNLAGMPFAPLISVIVGVTNIIPFFGPFIGAIPSAFIILIADPSMTFWFILMIFVIQQLDGNVIGPKILGNSTGMTSLAVLVAITIAGGFFGFAGMIFGVPAAAVICALTRQFTDKRLRMKQLPTDLAYYEADPPFRDFNTQTVIMDSSETVEGEAPAVKASEDTNESV